MIILDESHHALATTKHVISGGISQIRLGSMKLPLAPDGIKVASSGTPFRSDNRKAWGVLNWLWSDIFSSFWRFADEHWGTAPTGFQGAKVIGKKLKDEDKFRDMLRPYYLARTKAQVAPHLKPIEYAGTHPPGNPDGPCRASAATWSTRAASQPARARRTNKWKRWAWPCSKAASGSQPTVFSRS